MFQTIDLNNNIVHINFNNVLNVFPFCIQCFCFKNYTKILFFDDSEVIIKEDFELIFKLFKEFKKNV